MLTYTQQRNERRVQKIRYKNFDRLVSMAAVCYSSPISAVSINKQLLVEKRHM